MDDSPAGHRETQTQVPDPLAGSGLWNMGTWALPAVTLSIASAAVFVIVWLFLQHDREMRSLFVLPWYVGLPIAAGAAALAWTVVLHGRRRPGWIGPRLWVLALAVLNSLFAVLVPLFPKTSWTHALVFAGFAAALTLTPRLVKLRPDVALVQRIAPLSLFGVLFVVLPTVWGIGNHITEGKRDQVELLIQQLQLWTSEVREVTGYDWKRMEADREGALHNVERLKRLSFAGRINDLELWREAVILGKDTELAKRSQELMDAVVVGLNPKRVPRVSSFEEPALHWNHDQKHWEANADFQGLSVTVGEYHHEIGRLFAELEVTDLPVLSQPLVDLEGHYRTQRDQFKKAMTGILGSWPDNWAVFRIPQHRVLIGRESLPLSEMLQVPLFATEEPLAAGNLWKLTSLPLGEVRRLGRKPPGCRPLEYTEGLRDYFRLDCYSYSPQGKGEGAELRIEMRLVYESEPGKSLAEYSLPAEVYFLFPIPPDEGSDNFRETVMTGLANASRRLSGRSISGSDRGNSVASGFRILGDGSSVLVYYPTVVPLLGEQRALQVRAARSISWRR